MKRIPTSLVLVAVLFVIAILGYGWWYQVLAEMSTHAAELDAKVLRESQSAERSSAAHAALERLAQNREMVEAHFIAEDTIVSFLGQLETIGKNIGATVRVSSVGAPTDDGLRSLPILLSVEGNFDAVMRTIGAIEHAPYASSITGVKFQLISSEKVPWNATVSMKVGSTLPPPAETD